MYHSKTINKQVEDFDYMDVQADVLATDISENTKIAKLKQLQTETKVPTKAINALNEQLGNAQTSASDAVQRVVALENIVRAGGQADNTVVSADMSALLSALCKDVRSWSELTKDGEEFDTTEVVSIPSGEDINEYLPDKALDVKFNNSPSEKSVNIFWKQDEIDEENGGPFEVHAQFEQGYFSRQAPTCIVNITNDKVQHVMGIVLNADATENTYAQWVRVNENFETIPFDSRNGIWKNMQEVTTAYGDFVEIPTTWVKTEILEDGPYAGKVCYWVADKKTKGFHVHPAFLTPLGKPGKLRIGAYLASKDSNNQYVSVRKSSYTTMSYSSIHTFSTDDGYKAYTIYDHHLLARLALIEFGTPNTKSSMKTTENSTTYYTYHKIYDMFTSCILDCVQYYNGNGNSCLYLAEQNGIENMISIPLSMTKGILYPKNCFVDTKNNIDMSDIFIVNETMSISKSNFDSTQDFAYSSDSNETMEIISSSNSIFGLSHARTSTSYNWRLSQVVDE